MIQSAVCCGTFWNYSHFGTQSSSSRSLTGQMCSACWPTHLSSWLLLTSWPWFIMFIYLTMRYTRIHCSKDGYTNPLVTSSFRRRLFRRHIWINMWSPFEPSKLVDITLRWPSRS